MSTSMVRATNVASAAEGERQRPERVLERPSGLVLVRVPMRRGRRVLALGQAVDLVVEQEDLDVHVAAEGVDQVVAADGQAVAVAGDDPDLQVRAGEPCRPVAKVGARPWMVWKP